MLVSRFYYFDNSFDKRGFQSVKITKKRAQSVEL